MPYRRLPNTDQARLRALRTILTKGSKSTPEKLPFSQKRYLEIQAFLPQFEQAVSQYKTNFDKQASLGKQLSESYKTCKLFVSHYIQVLNFIIIRNELKPEVRLVYGVKASDRSVPEITTKQQLVTLGDMLIKGEEQRCAMGGTRLYNPSIAVVKVKYEQYIEVLNNHKNLQTTTQKYHDRLIEFRAVADEHILNIWNEIEESYCNLPANEKRDSCSEYGLVYLLRTSEKQLVSQ